MSMDPFDKYAALFGQGQDPQVIYRAAKADGLDGITCIRLLRHICGLSLVEAKRVIVTADERTESLEAYQEKLSPGVKHALQGLEEQSGTQNSIDHTAAGGMCTEPGQT